AARKPYRRLQMERKQSQTPKSRIQRLPRQPMTVRLREVARPRKGRMEPQTQPPKTIAELLRLAHPPIQQSRTPQPRAGLQRMPKRTKKTARKSPAARKRRA